MKKQWLIGVIAVWVVSIAIASVVAWNLGSARNLRIEQETREEPVSTVPTPPAQDRLRQEPAPTAADLERENAELREELAELKDEMQQAARDCLMYAISQALRDAENRKQTEEEVPVIWQKDYEALRKAKSAGGMFAGLDEADTLTVNMALLGEPGIEHLRQVARDTQRSDEERKSALGCLAYIPHKVAFETLMEMQGSELLESRFDYYCIKRHVAALPKSDIERHIPEINRRIAGEMGTNTNSYRPEVLACLALIHEDHGSLSLLRDQRIHSEMVDAALIIAEAVHTDEARRFVEDSSQSNQFPGLRKTGARMLEDW